MRVAIHMEFARSNLFSSERISAFFFVMRVIFDDSLLYCMYSTFVSVPADFGGLSVDSYISGIVAGILEGAGFPARVTAHSVALEDGEAPPVNTNATMMSANNSNSSGVPAAANVQGLPLRKEKTVFLVKFAQSVLTRDSQVS